MGAENGSTLQQMWQTGEHTPPIFFIHRIAGEQFQGCEWKGSNRTTAHRDYI